MPTDILTPEEVSSCYEAAGVSVDRVDPRAVQHAALLGARKALTEFQAWNGGANSEWFREAHYPLPRPARVPRKVPIDGQDWELATETTGVCVKAAGNYYRDLSSFIGQLAKEGRYADIAAIAGLPENPWEDK